MIKLLNKGAAGRKTLMDRQTVFEWIKRKYGTDPDYPWKDSNAVLRHRENKKWFALIMEVGRDKLGLPGEGTVDVMNVKCDPMLIGSLRTQPGFLPAYHMNKDQWISILLDGTAPEEEIKSLITMSYELTNPKKKAAKMKRKNLNRER
jgi:predicted DNA-binding protein (MmcQ/YjbR family)